MTILEQYKADLLEYATALEGQHFAAFHYGFSCGVLSLSLRHPFDPEIIEFYAFIEAHRKIGGTISTLAACLRAENEAKTKQLTQ